MSLYIKDFELIELCKNNNDPKCDCINKKTKSKSEARLFKSFECYAPECFNNNNYITQLVKDKQKRCNITSCESNIDKLNIDSTSHIKIKNNCTLNTKSSENFDLENIYRPLSYDIVPQNNIFNNLLIYSIIIIYGVFEFL